MAARRCPECGKQEMYVIASYPRKQGLPSIGIHHMVRRRRLECENCGHRCTTYELEEGDINNLRGMLMKIRKKARLSKSVMGRLETAIRRCRADLERVDKE